MRPVKFLFGLRKKKERKKRKSARGKRSFCFSAYIVYGEGNWARGPNAIRHMYTLEERGERGG